MAQRTRAAMQQESDLELARAAAPSGMKTLEGFYLIDPGNRALIGLLAETYCQYGAGFLNDDWEDALMRGQGAEADAVRVRARKLLSRCVSYALLLLGKKWQHALFDPDDPEAALPLVEASGKGAVEGMFWVALGLGTMIGMDPSDARLVSYLPLVTAMLERVIELDDDYLDGLPHMTMGIILSARSAAVGGDPARGKQHFERARALTHGKSLIIDVMMARTYAVTTRDQALFRKTLVRILRTPPGIWPEGRLSNEMAHRKARRYLMHQSRFF